MNNHANTAPPLRFPSFEDSWQSRKIQSLIDDGSIVSHLDGNHGELYPRTEEFSKDGVPYISANDFVDGDVNFSGCKFLPVERAAKFKKGVARDGDVLFAHNATVGPTAILRTTFAYVILSTTATYFRCNPASLWNAFLRASLEADYFVRQYTRVMSQSTRNQVPITMQRTFFLQIPTLPEQRKIAEFLTAVDGRIQQLSQKKALLEDYKKGVMQQLFTQTLRFKDDHGNDFPDWEEKTLGKVSHNVGYGMNAAATAFDGVTKYIRITDIDESSNKFRPDPVTSPDEHAGDQFKLKKGDIVFARTGASVGKSYLYDEADGNLAFAGFLIRFSIREDVANPVFIFHQTLTQDYWRWVKVYSMRSGQPGINAEEYKTFTIQLPSIPEQTKIANFLTALDRKIESVASQVTLTQTFKRGLLQQMFV